ncbi:DUF1772 domain-containing protein [Nonomuraea jabiensis]|uniref:anthrone oxygenase family protein n=1 Tax=Nonomuraea jabiensis TaxID=882448 RepID=UPI003417FC22
METLRVTALMAATLAMGLAAGAFALYAHTIMPGLGRTDDRTFVAAFQATDRAIMNVWFIGLCFFGALIFTALAAFTHIGQRALPWIVAALILYAVAVVITLAVNVPLNDMIKNAGDPARIDVAAVRERFDEARWIGWNLVRVVTSTAAFGLLAWSLTLTSR